jgi:hypothetical protein
MSSRFYYKICILIKDIIRDIPGDTPQRPHISCAKWTFGPRCGHYRHVKPLWNPKLFFMICLMFYDFYYKIGFLVKEIIRLTPVDTPKDPKSDLPNWHLDLDAGIIDMWNPKIIFHDMTNVLWFLLQDRLSCKRNHKINPRGYPQRPQNLICQIDIWTSMCDIPCETLVKPKIIFHHMSNVLRFLLQDRLSCKRNHKMNPRGYPQRPHIWSAKLTFGPRCGHYRHVKPKNYFSWYDQCFKISITR